MKFLKVLFNFFKNLIGAIIFITIFAFACKIDIRKNKSKQS